ncbi:S9 family peptidase [Shewanella sp. SNU WT4]|uniref:S9 family peptidase n=1 Tax=Shewanella sp. SNU WT4 TaxID=2590015 RepID=UPI001126AFF2|nr:prolyl oligopeptidase family serine peptidase [Shewanella sp. SNU WT4]QDF66461.1 S9 family peptidase [Shewanella sp. SNU WT4]
MKLLPLTLIASLVLAGIAPDLSIAATARTLELTDVMQFKSLAAPQLSANGEVLAVEVSPDRGDSEVLIKRTDNSVSYQIANASNPQISRDGRFVAVKLPLSLFDQESKDKQTLKKLTAGMALLDTHTGHRQTFAGVESFAFNPSGTVLAIWFEAPEPDKKAVKNELSANASKQEVKDADGHKPAKDDIGRPLTLVLLDSAKQVHFDAVSRYAFAKHSPKVLLAEVSKEGSHIMLVDGISGDKSFVYEAASATGSITPIVGALAISDDGKQQAFTLGDSRLHIDARHYQLWLTPHERLMPIKTDANWPLNRYAQLRFNEVGDYLFFGRVPEVSRILPLAKISQQAELFNIDKVTAQRELNVWHGDDPRIKPHEIKQYNSKLEHNYWAALNTKSLTVQQLADSEVATVHWPQMGNQVLMSSDKPYLTMITWAGFYRDYYLFDLTTGSRRLVLTQQDSDQAPSLSPNGRYLVYFHQGQVKLYDVAAQKHSVLTAAISTPFADEDNDYPKAAPGYGVGPWLDDDSAVLVYDKYDVWQLSSLGKAPLKLTSGREAAEQYRVQALVDDVISADSKRPATVRAGEAVLVHAYNERTKSDSLHQLNVGILGTKALAGSAPQSAKVKIKLLARARDADTLVFSQERFDLYPDLYVSPLLKPQQAVRLTELDKQRQAFDWGAAQLVQWQGADGKPLDGVLITPTNYQAGKPVPVLVYFYRFMSDRLHAFPEMKINHRPNFAWYAANGYAIFLPDIRFEIGAPGHSSTLALTSGVQKLIDMGIADANAVGIHGHSWGGYQTAFVVTQTPMFKATVSGAPVSNMTSAYSAIRHGTGLARQFQYETGQSRIGDSLFESPQKYIENSPVFYADRITTPMMIMFGDKDDAVPWEQGVEMYLAMRRAGKEVVMLQYQDEPHHLKKYPNKLDYSIKMKQYFDHYLKGSAAPQWLSAGEAYQPRPNAEE